MDCLCIVQNLKSLLNSMKSMFKCFFFITSCSITHRVRPNNGRKDALGLFLTMFWSNYLENHKKMLMSQPRHPINAFLMCALL